MSSVSPPWQLSGGSARLEIGRFGATVDVARPELGLHDVRLPIGSAEGCRLLGAELSQGQTDPHPELVDAYCRGNDLVATYGLARRDPLRVQLYWRVLPAEQAPVLLAVDLLVSVQTNVLHSAAGMFATTQMPSGEVLQLVDAAGARFERLAAADGPMATRQPADGPGCVVLRLPHAPLSYVEMIHPADFRTLRLGGEGGDGQLCRLRHDLFASDLEKGVILRSRLRGLFVSRDEDTDRAAASYLELVAQEPPLGT